MLRAELEAQRAQFVEPASYSFTFVPSCFCPPEYSGRIRISVNNGSITARYADSMQPVPERVRLDLATMAGTFDDLASRLAEGSPTRSEWIHITYDPVLHYPSDIRVSGSFPDSSAEDRRFDFVTPADPP